MECHGDYRPWDSPFWLPWRFSQGGPIHPTRAFYGKDEALGLPALYACVRLLADSLASLPVKIYTRNPSGDRRAIRYTGPSIFDKPSVVGTTYDWLHTLMTSLLLQGNAWGFITGRDGYGFPTGIEWIPPEDVNVMDDELQPWNPLRSRIYVYGRLMQRDELFHIRAFTLAGRTEGISPLRAFAMTVLAGIEAQRYGTDWYRAGGFPPGHFKNSQIEIDTQQAEEIREMLVSTMRRREPLVYGADWTYEPITVPPSEAQFVEAMRMNATHMASVYGLPPDRVGGTRGDSLTYNCSVTDSEILTTKGWLRYDEVKPGDTCLTLNTITGLAEWQPVTSVHVFEDGPYDVIEMESQSHSSATTPNHRWPVTTDSRPGWHWRTTETLTSAARVSAAVPVAAPVEPKWSDALVELMAWFWTEGWIGSHGQVTLTQSAAVNERHVTSIRAALTELFGPDVKLSGRSLLGSRGWQKRELIRAELARDPGRSDREIARTCAADGHTVAAVRRGKADGPGWTEDISVSGISHFRLNTQAGQVLLEHAPGKIVSAEFLSQLTRAQLELFYQKSVDADGCRVTGSGRDRTQIGQKDKARLEAFQVACALTGRSAVIPRQPNSRGMYYMSIYASSWRKPAGHPGQVTKRTAPAVWCVQTPNRTWFARRNGTCYFTGNTVEQGILQVIESLRPWMVRLEHAFFNLLPEKRYVRFDSDALLKTDLKTRTEIYTQQRNIGLRTIDELRDLEDLEPLPEGVGQESIPLEVIVAMARTTRGIPKTLMPQLTLEMDLAADLLRKLQSEGIAAPNTEPSVISPEQLVGRILATQRDSGGAQGRDDADKIMDFLAANPDRMGQLIRLARKADGGTEPEYVGAWVPSPRDLVLNGHNGNGRH